MATAKDVNAYIAGFPENVQVKLQHIRSTIQELVPEAEEAISYGIPTFNLNKRYLIYFAAYKNHLSIYPAPVGNPDFAEDFESYKTGKGTVQFPLSQPVPIDIVKKIVRFRIAENKRKSVETRTY